MTSALSGSAIAGRIGHVYPSLSRAHRKTADYVLSHPFQAAATSIDELARAAGVSVATANRFARLLGFSSYPQFRTELVRGFESALAPVERLRTGLQRHATIQGIFAEALEEDVGNLQATVRNLDAARCEEAVRAILSARRIYVVGLGTSAYLGGLLVHGLESYCDVVQQAVSLGGPAQAARRLLRTGPKDLVIAIAFPRYMKDTLVLTRLARNRGAKVLALTNDPSSPLAPLGDMVLYAQSARRLSSNSETAVLALIEALCSAVAYRAKDSLSAATEFAEQLVYWLHVDKTSSPAGPITPQLAGGKPPRKQKD